VSDTSPHRPPPVLRRPPSRAPLALCAMLLGVLCGWLLHASASATEPSASSPTPSPYAKLDTFAQVLSQIERAYVEPPDEDLLIYSAIKGMVRHLDPHSSFLTPDELLAMRDRTAGHYVGVGVEIGMRDNHVVIIAPVEGGPAEAAGVQAADIIVSIDGKPSLDWDVAKASEHLRGPEGSTLKLKLKRASSPDLIDVTLTRQIVSIISLKHEPLDPGYGYIAIRSFTQDVHTDLRAAYADLLLAQPEGQPLRGLILDLRNNPGGLLREAIFVTNAFISDGLIVSTEGRRGVELGRHEALSDLSWIDCPLVVLVNAGSASASEIVAGALQDHQRAVIVGTQTFGKGSVQNIYDLPDGSGLKLTIARYFTPHHRAIQGKGITPDILAEDVLLPDPAPAPPATRERDLPNALDPSSPLAPDPDPAPAPASPWWTRDLPTRTALDQLKAFQILSGQRP
jgi:carboxyl-terminal processing protease